MNVADELRRIAGRAERGRVEVSAHELRQLATAAELERAGVCPACRGDTEGEVIPKVGEIRPGVSDLVARGDEIHPDGRRRMPDPDIPRPRSPSDLPPLGSAQADYHEQWLG